MTAPASTLVRAIEEAAGAREASHLLTYASTGPVTLKAGDPTVLADVDILKVGTYNGWNFTAADLEACVEHFASLTESGIFTPPVRLDHSWSILQVVGYIDALRTAVDVDASTGNETTFLRADLRITEAQALGLIQRGTAVNRSAEIGPYETNSGVIYPIICYGVAFVDIPAVEGLRPIQLSRQYGSPRTVTKLNGKGSTMGDTDTAGSGSQTGAPAATSGSAAAAATDASTATSGDQAGQAGGAQGGQAATGSAPATAAPTSTEPPEGETETARELRQLREERKQLRDEAREQDLARFREAGIVVPANTEHASTLLGHEDAAVRGAARALLGSLRPPVALGQRVGVQTSSTGQTSTGGTGGAATSTAGGTIDLTGQGPDEVGAWWAELDTAQRKAGTPEHAAMTKWRQDRRGS